MTTAPDKLAPEHWTRQEAGAALNEAERIFLVGDVPGRFAAAWRWYIRREIDRSRAGTFAEDCLTPDSLMRFHRFKADQARLTELLDPLTVLELHFFQKTPLAERE